MRRTRRGLSGYVADPQWTGTPETTTGGPHAGIYPSRDITRYWSRAAGLGQIARGRFRRGMGQDSTYDPTTDTTSSGLDALSFPDSGMPSAAAGSTVLTSSFDPSTGLTTSTGGGSSSVSSSGFNLNSFLSSLTGAAAMTTAAALQQPGAQLLANGSVLLPNGTIVPAASATSSSTILLIGGALLLVLVLSMRQK